MLVRRRLLNIAADWLVDACQDFINPTAIKTIENKGYLRQNDSVACHLWSPQIVVHRQRFQFLMISREIALARHNGIRDFLVFIPPSLPFIHWFLH